jgi:nucleotide-binding universal stress UspA family protein
MRILVPVDGSARANRAVEHALLLTGGCRDAEITLLNVQSQEVLDVSEICGVMTVEADRKLAADRSKKALGKAIRLCRNANVKFAVRSELGPIAETINGITREVKANQIVMGTRGLGPLRGLVLGSVATKVVQIARVP